MLLMVLPLVVLSLMMLRLVMLHLVMLLLMLLMMDGMLLHAVLPVSSMLPMSAVLHMLHVVMLQLLLMRMLMVMLMMMMVLHGIVVTMQVHKVPVAVDTFHDSTTLQSEVTPLPAWLHAPRLVVSAVPENGGERARETGTACWYLEGQQHGQ